MPTLVRDLKIAEDDWRLVDEGPAAPGLIAPLDAWRKNPDGAGVWLRSDTEIDAVAEEVLAAPVIAIEFPAFADGRGLSMGALLRSRHGYQGELRAFGEVVPDLTEYMHRCGFNAFVMASERDAEAAIASIGRMSDHYQASVREPVPPFRRSTA